MSVPCSGGGITLLQVDNTDCNCVSISRIVNNGNGTFTITLTNGQSISFTIPGAAAGVIAMRVSSGYIQYSSNGGAWTNLIALTGLGIPGLIWSDPVNRPTTTNGSFETLSSFATDHTNAGKNLTVVGDTIKLYSAFNMISSPTATGILTRLNLNGVGLSNVAINAMSVGNASDALIELITEIILSDATAGAMMLRINSRANIWDGTGIYSLRLPITKIPIADIGGATVDFSANDYTFSAQAQSIATGDVQLQIYQAEKISKL